MATIVPVRSRGLCADDSLSEFFSARFEPEQMKDRAAETRSAYRRAVARFRVFLEREPVLGDLALENCERFEAWLAANGFACKSGHDGYRCLVAIWRFAFHADAIDTGPPLKRKRGPSPSESFLSDTAGKRTAKLALLIDFARQYAIERGLAPVSAGHLRHVINSFGKSLNRRPRLSDLRDDTVNRWAATWDRFGVTPTISGRPLTPAG